MTGDTTPQQQAVEALIKAFRPKVSPFVGLKPDMDRDELAVAYPARTLTLGEIADCLADAGLLQGSSLRSSEASPTGGESSAERDKEELVQRIAAELADYRLDIGPNTRELIASGSWTRMPLSVSERRDIAELAAREALRQVDDA